MSESMPGTPGVAAVRDAYASWAPAYIDLFGDAERASTEDRALIAGWAGSVTGTVLDAGCGPGHWSAFIRSLGVAVEGVDMTAEFVEHASRAYPGIRFSQGDLRHLRLPDGGLGGVLAWFSLIHLAPEEVPQVVKRFAAALRPDGRLLVGFFAGPAVRAFDHRVVTAWAWPVAELAAVVRDAGFEVLDHRESPQSSGRVFAWLTAVRAAA